MDLSKILSISGMPGLYKVIGQMKNGVIVESLIDGKRQPAYASNKISALEDISIYTTTEDKPLKEILKLIYTKENGKKIDSEKLSDNEVKSWMESVLPDYDKERVYTSDIKKLLKWYNLLISAGLISLEEEKKEGAKQEESTKDAVEKPAKKTKAKEPKPATEGKAAAKPKTTAAKKTTTAPRRTSSGK
jgi:hypothetical protein